MFPYWLSPLISAGLSAASAAVCLRAVRGRSPFALAGAGFLVYTLVSFAGLLSTPYPFRSIGDPNSTGMRIFLAWQVLSMILHIAGAVLILVGLGQGLAEYKRVLDVAEAERNQALEALNRAYITLPEAEGSPESRASV